jgi:hypothetical protein
VKAAKSAADCGFQQMPELVTVLEEMRMPDDFFVRLPQPRFHQRGHETGGDIRARAGRSRSSVFGGGNAGKAIGNSNHRNLLSEPSSAKAFKFGSDYCNAI